MQELYFAASNSGAGFVCYYDQLFTPERFGRIYLIKGGPGTGKSSLMRRVAAEAERRGLAVRRYACSSDPDSLDAVAVEDCFAMLDATAPHTRETVLPGAGDEMIDLGQFWDSALLTRARDEIAVLNHRKKAAYRRAYSWLAGAAACTRNRTELLRGCVDLPKLQRAAMRCLDGLTAGQGRLTPALTEAISMRGRVCLDSMHAASARAMILSGTRGGGSLFLEILLDLARARGIDAEVAWGALVPEQLTGIAFLRDGLAVVDEEFAAETREGDRVINMGRFWLPDRLRAVRTELRHGEHCREAMLAGASLSFAEVRAAHFALEAIYAEAMDFASLSAWRDAFLPRIFAETAD